MIYWDSRKSVSFRAEGGVLYFVRYMEMVQNPSTLLH